MDTKTTIIILSLLCLFSCKKEVINETTAPPLQHIAISASGNNFRINGIIYNYKANITARKGDVLHIINSDNIANTVCYVVVEEANKRNIYIGDSTNAGVVNIKHIVQ